VAEHQPATPVVGLAKTVLLALGKEDRTKKLIEALAKLEASGVFWDRQA
jgi:hypothetical protein